MTIPKEDIKNISPNLISLRQKLVDIHLGQPSSVFTFSSEGQGRNPLSEECQKKIKKAFFASDAELKDLKKGVFTPLELALSSVEKYREKNKLKVVNLPTSAQQESEFVNLEDKNAQPFYTQNAPSKLITRVSLSSHWQGWVDFFVTTNNEIILSPTDASMATFLGHEELKSHLKASSSKQEASPSLEEASSSQQETPPSLEEASSSQKKKSSSRHQDDSLSSAEFNQYSNDFNRYINLYTLSWGASVKTAGKLRIENQAEHGQDRLMLAAESDYWEVDKDKMIPIFLQTLLQSGIKLSKENIFYLDKKDGLPRRASEAVPQEFLKSVDGYLTSDGEVNTGKYPLETKIAEGTNPAVGANLTSLFLAIDNAVLNSKNPEAIELFLTQDQSSNTFDLLKKEMAQFLSSCTQPDATSSMALEESVLSRIKKIKNTYQINLNFAYEDMISLYLCYVKVKREYKASLMMDQNKEAIPQVPEDVILDHQKQSLQPLVDMNNIEKIFQHAAENIGNSSQYNEVKSFPSISNSPLRYEPGDPLEKSIKFLRDYIGYGTFWRQLALRLFYRRKHINLVKNFLDNYYNDKCSVKSIDDVCYQIFTKHLSELQEQTGTCIERLRYCAGIEARLNPTKNLFGSEPGTDGEVVAKITALKKTAEAVTEEFTVKPQTKTSIETIPEEEEFVDASAESSSARSIPLQDDKTESSQSSSEQEVNAENLSAIATRPSSSDVHEESSTVEKVTAPSLDGIHEESSAKENVSTSPLSLSPSRSQAALYSSKEKNDNVRSSSPQDDRSSEVYRP